jgi:hypothetical protein
VLENCIFYISPMYEFSHSLGSISRHSADIADRWSLTRPGNRRNSCEFPQFGAKRTWQIAIGKRKPAGENLGNVMEIRRICEAQALDIGPSLAKMGGISEMMKARKCPRGEAGRKLAASTPEYCSKLLTWVLTGFIPQWRSRVWE